MRVPVAAVLAALVTTPVLAQAPSASAPAPTPVTQVRTVADLAAVCDPRWTGVSRLEAIAYCQGFLTGAGQFHTLLHPTGTATSRPVYCVPSPGPTVAESGVAFAAWARQNPQHANDPAVDGLMRWAGTTYPCNRNAAAPARAPRAAR
ncbi:Rap1a/Tai family immunity protein [Plastoroseomonas hellenica]|uniref:Rap1a/Tai family immunity protein n=1 Tax=Plastoroseomonas hellenica TaxID=2687306 RepID=UPI001BA5F668|nr:Rap1a/Tai family immunity protein [Plastoroseomonas hellenica]MBR0645537.1 hypothetical protein [Plastoroseomonas hellenica]